ncbi:hypothetical protein GCM10020256_60540 [Streptomyces thermocoprophilus]
MYATTVPGPASASFSTVAPAVTGTSVNGSVPSVSTAPDRAARSCIAVIPGTVSTTTPGTSPAIVCARYVNVEYTFGSPMVANATDPRSRSSPATRSPAASHAASRRARSLRSFSANTTRTTFSGSTWCSTVASARPRSPVSITGTTTTAAARSAFTPLTVTSSGSPGPTPTPHQPAAHDVRHLSTNRRATPGSDAQCVCR